MVDSAKPLYELRAFNHGVDDLEIEVFQKPCTATPHITEPVRIAGLRGRNMTFVERQVLRRLNNAGIEVTPAQGERQVFPIDEEVCLNMSLLFRLLAPMRNADRMRQVALGVTEMNQTEAAYWLGMCLHRKKPRRVLCALRIILTDANL